MRALPCLVLLASCTPFMPVMEQCTSQGCDAGSTGGGTAVGGGSAGGGDTQDPDGGPSFCELNVSELQFGVVSVGDARALAVIIDNPTSSPVTLIISAPNHPSYELLSGEGTTTLKPGQSVTANVRFTPTSLMEVLASVSIQRASVCAPRSLALRGEGIASAVEWTPASIDFGAVPPDITSTQSIIFRNGGSRPATLTEVSASGSPFSMMAPTTSLVVPAHGELTVGVQVRPVVLGPRTAAFRFTTPDRVRTEVPLRVVGGGPVLKVASVLDFGRVAFLPGATQSRFLHLSNEGSGQVPGGLLRLGTVVNGRPAQPPLFEVVPVSNLTASEVTVSLAGFPNTMGLATGQAAYVEVSLTPTSPGLKRAELRLFSNDQRTPVTVVQLEANVVSVPGCAGLAVPELTAGVSSLDFGQVEPGRVVRRGVTLVNAGTQACEVADLDVSPPYRIEGGRVAAFQLQPGAKRQVIVELRLLPNTTAVPGVLRAFVASANAPTVTVPLTATPGTDCLVFSPGEVDFASNAPGCGATRSVVLVNRCSGTLVEVTSLRTIGGAFSVQGPMSASLTSGATAMAQVVWRPTSLGVEVGALAVTSTQRAQTITSWLLLSGAGAMGPITDTIVVPPDKADVLIVMDDSCSMAPNQTLMAANIDTLLQSISPVADSQVGVTVTGRATPRFGQLRTGDSPYVTAAQGNRLQQLQIGLSPGITGAGNSEPLSAALAALTPPLSMSINQGFVRDDARLAILTVSDGEDQSPFTVASYAAVFSSLKARPEHLTFSAMAPLRASGPPPGCTYRGRFPATRTQDVASLLRGAVEEICSNNWAAALAALGSRMAPSSSFSLRAPVDQMAGPVTVAVQGQQVMPGPSTWSLSPSTNSIVFTRAAIPQTGETVTVTYPVTCLP